MNNIIWEIFLSGVIELWKGVTSSSTLTFKVRMPINVFTSIPPRKVDNVIPIAYRAITKYHQWASIHGKLIYVYVWVMKYPLNHFYPSVRGQVTNTEPFVRQMRCRYIGCIHEQRTTTNRAGTQWCFFGNLSRIAQIYED